MKLNAILKAFASGDICRGSKKAGTLPASVVGQIRLFKHVSKYAVQTYFEIRAVKNSNF